MNEVRELNDADFRMQMPAALRTRIDERARQAGCSRNEWIRRVCRWGLEQPLRTETRREQT